MGKILKSVVCYILHFHRVEVLFLVFYFLVWNGVILQSQRGCTGLHFIKPTIVNYALYFGFHNFHKYQMKAIQRSYTVILKLGSIYTLGHYILPCETSDGQT